MRPIARVCPWMALLVLAACGGADATTPPAVRPVDTTTTVITPGESVDEACNRADEQYRTLFGEAAYNRQGMNSAIEVRLPEDPH